MARHGLLIGVSRFDDARLSALNAPARDVTALAEVLRDPARGGFDTLAVSLDEDYLTVRDRLAALFESRDPDDMVLLYYSGHGVLRRGNRLFLATPASELDRPQARSIAASEIRDLMDQCRAERQVLILDCCHSGAFGEHAKGAAAAAVTDDTFAGAGAGRYVLTASDSQQFAWDGGELKEGDTADRKLSSFTSWLVRGIGFAEAAPDEADITLDSVFRYVCRRARAEGAAATPQSFVDRATGELVIARNPAVASQAEVETQAAKLASEDWEERYAAAEALGKFARRSTTRDAARDTLADRLGVERDFKVRAAILKALELREEAAASERVRSSSEAEHQAQDQGVRSNTPALEFSAGEVRVLQQAGISQQQWPRLPSAVVDQVRLFARAIFWGRVMVWVAWGLAVLDLMFLVQLKQQPGVQGTDDPAANSLGLAVIQIVTGLMCLLPSRWRIVVAPPPVSAEYSQLANSMGVIRFKQFAKWSFNPPYELGRLRRAAIILLVSGGLTLLLAAVMGLAGQQSLSSTGYPKY